MADHGHELTDEILADLEKRLHNEYEQAAKDLQKKLDKYMKKFATKDAIWKKSVEAGIRTQEEYDQWRLQAIAAGERWEKMKARIVSDQLHTNQIAREIMNKEMPGIFELNANFALYQVEHDSQIDTSLTLYNREAVDRILRDDPEMLLPPGRRVSEQIRQGKAERWERQKVQSVMTQGILQGESIPKLASRLASAVADSDYKAAVRNARTMATNAQNAGRYDAYNRLESNGVELTLEWAATLDNRTRHEHRMMHGQRRNVGEPFEVSGVKIMYPAQTGSFMSIENAPQELIWNCFTGDNMVDVDSQIVRSYKHEYSGELVTIETASGINFTCTPNHPILTRFGWIPAAALHKGDDLLVTSTVDDGPVGRDGNVDHVHASFKAFHESLSKLGRVDQRPMTDFNFHGDVPASDVEVVSQERLLRGCIDTGISQGFYESVLKNADPLVFSKRHLVASFRRVYISTLRFMSRGRKALSLFWRGIGHANVHGLGAVADRDVVLPEYAINDLPAETVIRSQLLDGLAGRVFIDNIISVHKCSSTCHVYNLQTENGYYFVGSSINRNGGKSNGNYIIAKNCRCTILAYVKGYEHDTITHSDKMGKMTFEEWLEAKPKSQNILHQAQRGDQIEQEYINEYRKMNKEADEILKNRSTVVNGKDISETWKRRKDQFDFGIDDVINAQGFDGLPVVITDKDQFDALAKKSGIYAQRAYTGPDKETVQEYQNQLYNGKWYVDCSRGGAAWGQGMYGAASFNGKLTQEIEKSIAHYKYRNLNPRGRDWGEYEENIADWNSIFKDSGVSDADQKSFIDYYIKQTGGGLFSSNDAYEKLLNVYEQHQQEWAKKETARLRKEMEQKKNFKVETFTMHDSARIIKYEELEEKYNRARWNGDIGEYAAALGYDAIRVDNPYEGDDDPAPQIVILNRTKVIFLRED